MRIVFDAIDGSMPNAHEVVTFKNEKQFISIWPGDIVKATMKNGDVYEGEVGWSIEPGRIKIAVTCNRGIRFGIEALQQIEILQYSKYRPQNDLGSTCILDDLKCDMEKRLEAISDSYNDFIEGIWVYARVSLKRYNKVIDYLEKNPGVLSSDVIRFISLQDDFHDDSAVLHDGNNATI